MPPHPGAFIKKKLYLDNNLYEENFKIASDFEFFLRIFLKKNYNFVKLKTIVTRMKTGGISGKDIFSYFISTIEIIKSFKLNNIKFNLIYILMRFPVKIKQFIFFNRKKLNSSFKVKISKFFSNNYEYDFKIISNINKLRQDKNFILSAMNLAFLGSYVKNSELKFPYIYHWADGISAKLLERKIKKIPGREILDNLNINKTIKRIVVIGNLSNLSKKKLFLKYNIKIINHKVPYADFKTIFKSIKLK
jgi:hypothetical protein